MKEKYLGDGLYASFDGWMITLKSQRENGEHFVCLEEYVLQEFFRYVEECYQVDIMIKEKEVKSES